MSFLRAYSLILLAAAGAAWGGVALAQNASSFLQDPLQAESTLKAAISEIAAPDTRPCEAGALPKRVSLLVAVDWALCHNPQTRVSWAQASAAMAGLGAARSGYLPMISANATGERVVSSGGGSASGGIGTQRRGNFTAYGPELALSMLIYDFGQREAAVDAAREAMLSAGWSYRADMQQVMFETVQAFYQLQSAQEARIAAEQTEHSASEAWDAAKAKLEVGVVTPAETAQAEATYAQRRLQRQQAENTLTQAQAALARVLHVAPEGMADHAFIAEDPRIIPTDGELHTMIESAKASRPDAKAAQALAAQAKAEEARAKAADYPSINMRASTGETRFTQDNINKQRNSSVLLSVDVPIFTGFGNSYRIQAAREQATAAQATLARTQDVASQEVWNAYHDAQTAQSMWETAQTLIHAATGANDMAFGRYKEGKGVLLDVLTAQAQLADARLQLVQARYNMHVSRYNLLRALGTLDRSSFLEEAGNTTTTTTNQ